MGVVIKRNKKRQAFSASKIKRAVQKAAREAEYSSSEIKKLIRKVVNPVIKRFKSKEIVKSSQIRKAILSKLKKIAKPAYNSWKKYDSKH